MTDEETTQNEVVEQQDQVVQATDQAAESEEQHNEPQAKPETQKSTRNDQEYNWQMTRRHMQELERQLDEEREKNKKLSQKQTEEPELSPDDLLTVSHLNKVNARRDQATYVELQRQKEEILRLRYPDIDQVLSSENIAKFEQQEPELAETLATMQGDPIKLKQAAYKLIKNSMKPNATPITEKTKAEANSKKPLSVQAAGKSSALGNAHQFENGLTPELRKQLYKEMQDAIKHG